MATIGTPRALPTNPPDCVQYFHAACNEALGEWLPGLFPGGSGHASTAVRQRDAFVYENQPIRLATFPGVQGPADGTRFVYGDAGPPRGRVVYDYAHGIAFYDDGCCSWREVVEGYASAPPTQVVNRDLRAMKTVRGVQLGMSVPDVVHIYGAAALRPVPHQPGVRVLEYSTRPSASELKSGFTVCEQHQRFYFRDDRLVEIELGYGC